MKSLKEFILSKGTRNHIDRVQDANAKRLAKLRAAKRKKNPTFTDKFKKGFKKEGSHGPEGKGHTYSDYADKHAKKKVKLSKHIDQDAHAAKLGEDAPVNAVAHGGVDMNPTGKPKKFNDKRSRYDVTKMFRRNNG